MKHLFLLVLTFLSFSIFADTKALKTLAETSQWKQTGHYVEVERLCKAFANKFPNQVDCVTFGTTPEGRKMRALIVADSKKGLLAFWAKRKKRPVVFFQGGIHAGEIDGKDAGFWLIRQILEKEANPKLIEALKNVTLVFVPVFNVDGHERFGPNNRPNQNGPEEMGWRTTAQNYNLNRDYMKADSPEMQAMISFMDKWDPLVSLDLHVTDGAQFQHDVSLISEPLFRGASEVKAIASELQDTVLAALKTQGHLPLGFYPSFRKDDDPESGIALGVSPPRYFQGYWALKNRIAILVETHSWKDYSTRVKATRDTLENVILHLAKKGKDWRSVVDRLDENAMQKVGQSEGLRFDNTDKSKQIEFLGYKYQREDSDVSGETKITYFPNQPEVWKVPLFEEVVPKVSSKIPEGYLIPKAFASIVVPKLKIHGLKFKEISDDVGFKPVESFRADTFSFANKSFEGHQGLTVTGEWHKEMVTVNPGDIFVSCRQPKGLIAFHLLEPLGPDSLLAWGFFNTRFEPKEYLEGYVTEVVAKELLLKPEIKKAFEDKLDDPEFEKSPEKRLEFFHKLHPSWDKELGHYPVYRVDKRMR